MSSVLLEVRKYLSGNKKNPEKSARPFYTFELMTFCLAPFSTCAAQPALASRLLWPA
jgi:hypothetical protein